MEEIKKLTAKQKAAVNGWFGTHDIQPSDTIKFADADERRNALRAASNKAMGVPIRNAGSEEDILEFTDEEPKSQRELARKAMNKAFGIGK